MAFDADPEALLARFADDEAVLQARIVAARKLVGEVRLSDWALTKIAVVCAGFEVDGMRADLVTARAAVAHAAWNGRTDVTRADIRAAARLALPHRRRRNPFDAPGLDEDLLDQMLGDDDPDHPSRTPRARRRLDPLTTGGRGRRASDPSTDSGPRTDELKARADQPRVCAGELRARGGRGTGRGAVPDRGPHARGPGCGTAADAAGPSPRSVGPSAPAPGVGMVAVHLPATVRAAAGATAAAGAGPRVRWIHR